MKISKIKNAILNGEVIEKNAWSISVDENDDVLIFPPRGAGFKTSLGNIDKAVKDFAKRAEMPIPGVNTSDAPKVVSDPKLGPDSTTKEPFKTPSVNKYDKPDGAKSTTSLGEDTTTDEPFTTPRVNKRPPTNVETGGLPDTDLGEDTSGDEAFDAPVVTIQSDGRIGSKFVDTFSQEKTPDFYKEHRAPSAKLLEDIMDPEMWEANNWRSIAQYSHMSDHDEDLSNEYRQTKDTPALVGYEPEVYQNFGGDKLADEEIEAGCHGKPKKKKSLRRRGEGFTPSKKTETKPEVSDPGVSDKAEDSDRKADLDEATDYFLRDKKSQSLYDDDYPDAVDELVESFLNGNRKYVVEECMNDEALLMPVRDALSPEDKAVFDKIMQSKRGRTRQAGPKLREKWDDAGGYNRDMEAESAEELYHLVRSFGSEDDYDWSSYKPSMPIAPEGIEPGSGATDGKFEGEGLTGARARRLRAVDDEAKDYWKSYYGDYGKELVKDEAPRRDKSKKKPEKSEDKDEKKESRRAIRQRVKANIRRRDARKQAQQGDIPEGKEQYYGGATVLPKADPNYEDNLMLRDAPLYAMGDEVLIWDEFPGRVTFVKYEPSSIEDGEEWGDKWRYHVTFDDPDMPQRWVTEISLEPRTARRHKAQQFQDSAVQPAGQNSMEVAPPADTGVPGQAPPTTPQAPTNSKPKDKQEMAPGTGDSGLQALGWTPQDIQVMTDDEKQKILQIRLNKPGTKAPKPGGNPAEKPQGAPAPGAPAAPAATPAMPDEQAPAKPAPMQARLMARRLDQKFKIRRAQQALEEVPQEAPQEAPQAPAAPTGGPAPAAPPAAPVEAPEATGAGMGGTEEQALKILQEVRKQEVTATDSVGVSIQKNQILAQRLMTELGMSMEEARKLYGVKDTSKLFQ